MQPVSHLLAIGISLTIVSSALSSAQANTEVPAEAPKTEPAKTDPEPPKKEIAILGWKEWVWAVNPELKLRAKLDTGARTSSIHATNIQQIELDGKKWVKFTLSDPDDEKGIRLRHKAPLVLISKIKNDTGGVDERDVIPLVIKIGKTKLEGEFNLNDRENMTCSMLLGRNILKQLGVVDSSRTDLLSKPKDDKKETKKPDENKLVVPQEQK